MIIIRKLAPNVKVSDKIILFDGVCKLCHGWSKFIIKHDRQHEFKLCSVQSREGQQILEHFGCSQEIYETMLLVEGAACYEKSESFFRIMSGLGFPWKAVCIFRVIPLFFRDWLYDRIALNRYRLFGRYEECRLPSADDEKRFLHE